MYTEKEINQMMSTGLSREKAIEELIYWDCVDAMVKTANTMTNKRRKKMSTKSEKIQQNNAQRAEKLTQLTEAIKNKNNKELDKVRAFYNIPCYRPNQIGKSDKDIKFDIRKISAEIRNIESNAIQNAWHKANDSYLYDVVRELKTVLNLRSHYRNNKIESKYAYQSVDVASKVESTVLKVVSIVDTVQEINA